MRGSLRWGWCALLAQSCVAVTAGAAVAEVVQDAPGPQRYRAVSELAVGDLDGPVSLTRVEHVVVDGPRVYVSQPAERLIRVLSADSGELLDEWGGPGEGPGEMRTLYWMGRMDGRLKVMDTGLLRVTSFTPSGSVHETNAFRLPRPAPPFRFGGRILPTPDGAFVVVGDVSAREGTRPDVHPWVLADDDGSVLDTLPSFRVRDRNVVLRREGGAASFGRPIHRGDRFAMAVDGSMFVQAGPREGDGLTLSLYHTVERTLETFELRVPHVPVPRTVRDSLEAVLRAGIEGRGLARNVDRRTLDEALAMPEWIPAADEMFVTADGEIWLREPSFSGPHHLWRVVGPDGVLTAEVEVPFGVVLRDRAGEHVWGYRIDPDLHFSIVERFRLTRVEPGAEPYRRRP